MQEQNFADEIYKLFKSKRKTALRCNEVIEAYKKLYGRTLQTKELRELPFIQFERNANNNNNINNFIYLVVELDDCCNKCKFRYCKLLHSVDPSDKFQLIYQYQHKQQNDNNNHHQHKSKISKIERPNIRLIQRVKDILNDSKSTPKQVTLTEMKRIHNQRFPKYKSHEPTSHGIAIRFKSTFHIAYDDQSGDHLITFKHDQNHANLNSQYKNQSRYNRNGGYHSNSNTLNSNNYKKSNVIINSKKSHQSPWQKKTISKTQIPLNINSHNNNNRKYNNNNNHNVSPLSISNELQLSSSSNNANKNSNFNDNDDNHSNASSIRPNSSSSNNSTDHDATPIPEDPNAHYLSITISPEWNDSKLIPDLVRHISQHTGKHIADAFIAYRLRLGFFTAKTQQIAQNFVRAAKQRKIDCWGRTVVADIIPLPKNNDNYGIGIQRQQSGYRVKIQNVNCIMGRKDFEKWVHRTTNTLKKKSLVYDIEIVFPKIMRGAPECIMQFDQADDTKYVIDKIQNVQFRGFPLKFKSWIHPNFVKSKVMTNKPFNKNQQRNNKHSQQNRSNHHQQKIALNKNAIRKTASSKPQTSIWTQMANQRKQQKLHQQQQIQQPQSVPPTDNTAKDDNISNEQEPASSQQLTSPSKSNNINENALYNQKSSNPLKPSIAVATYNKADNNNNNLQPSQPTKPPKKSITSPPITNNDVSLSLPTKNDMMNTTSFKNTSGSSSMSADSPMSVSGGNKPRVPPLINRFRNSNNNNNNNSNSQPVSPTLDHATQTPPQTEDTQNEEIESLQTENNNTPQQEHNTVESNDININVNDQSNITVNTQTSTQSFNDDKNSTPINRNNQQQNQQFESQTISQQPQQQQQPQQPFQSQSQSQSQSPSQQQVTSQTQTQQSQATTVQLNGQQVNNLLNSGTILNQPLTQQQLQQQMRLNSNLLIQQFPQLQNNQITMIPVNVNGLQTLQQLQQQHQQQQLLNQIQQQQSFQPQFQIPNISTIPNLGYPAPYSNININMSPYIQQMAAAAPPPPSSFPSFTPTPTPQQQQQTPTKSNGNTNMNNNNNSFQSPQKAQMHSKRSNNNNNNNNYGNNNSYHHNNNNKNNMNQRHQKPQYQSPPRHNQHNKTRNQYHQNRMNTNYNNNNNNNNKQMQQKQHHQQQQHPNNQRNLARRSKQTDPLDKLCKFCLLATHEPNKCVWFNPNALYKH